MEGGNYRGFLWSIAVSAEKKTSATPLFLSVLKLQTNCHFKHLLKFYGIILTYFAALSRHRACVLLARSHFVSSGRASPASAPLWPLWLGANSPEPEQTWLKPAELSRIPQQLITLTTIKYESLLNTQFIRPAAHSLYSRSAIIAICIHGFVLFKLYPLCLSPVQKMIMRAYKTKKDRANNEAEAACHMWSFLAARPRWAGCHPAAQ